MLTKVSDQFNSLRGAAVGGAPLVFFLVFFLLLGSPLPAWAENLSQEESWWEEFQSLSALKEQDPALFRTKIQEKKNRLNARIQEMHQRDPERFGRFLARERQFKRRTLEDLGRKHPESFRKFAAVRRNRLQNAQARVSPDRPRRSQTNFPARNEMNRPGPPRRAEARRPVQPFHPAGGDRKQARRARR